MAKNRENTATGANPIHAKRKYTCWTEEEHKPQARPSMHNSSIQSGNHQNVSMPPAASDNNLHSTEDDPIKSIHFSNSNPVCQAFDQDAKDGRDLLIGLNSGDARVSFFPSVAWGRLSALPYHLPPTQSFTSVRAKLRERTHESYLRVFHYSKEQLICGRKSYYGALLCCAWRTLEFNQLSRNLPPELGNLPNLQRLELSFNKLSGQIPSSFEYGLRKTDYISNISYMFKLTILLDSVSYSLHINCGGKQITVNGNGTYDDDTDTAGPARFHLGGKKWGSSSTGHFMDNDRAEYSIWLNQSKLFIIDVELYMDARVSPISLNMDFSWEMETTQ
ncbi:hypothetical protein JHK86_016401 [Glycine max]|nr:hypothetical protein JHK86_016401 [Glycine max]